MVSFRDDGRAKERELRFQLITNFWREKDFIDSNHNIIKEFLEP